MSAGLSTAAMMRAARTIFSLCIRGEFDCEEFKKSSIAGADTHTTSFRC